MLLDFQAFVNMSKFAIFKIYILDIFFLLKLVTTGLWWVIFALYDSVKLLRLSPVTVVAGESHLLLKFETHKYQFHNLQRTIYMWGNYWLMAGKSGEGLIFKMLFFRSYRFSTPEKIENEINRSQSKSLVFLIQPLL